MIRGIATLPCGCAVFGLRLDSAPDGAGLGPNVAWWFRDETYGLEGLSEEGGYECVFTNWYDESCWGMDEGEIGAASLYDPASGGLDSLLNGDSPESFIFGHKCCFFVYRL